MSRLVSFARHHLNGPNIAKKWPDINKCDLLVEKKEIPTTSVGPMSLVLVSSDWLHEEKDIVKSQSMIVRWMHTKTTTSDHQPTLLNRLKAKPWNTCSNHKEREKDWWKMKRLCDDAKGWCKPVLQKLFEKRRKKKS